MNARVLSVLVIAALIALLGAFIANRASQPGRDVIAQATPLVPGLREHVNAIDRITLTGAGNQRLATLVRGDSGWTLTEKGAYPADVAKLRRFLLSLADATVLEEKTANKDRYGALGVSDVAIADAGGVRVELHGLSEPVSLIIGNVNGQGRGTFVRAAGEARSWLVSGTLTVDRSPADWLNKSLVDMPSAEIAEVVVDHGKAGKLRVFKHAVDDAQFTIADIPKGREQASDQAGNALAAGLSGLTFEDVAPAAEAEPGDGSFTARYLGFDGVAVTVIGWKHDDKDYAQLVASLDGAAAERYIAAHADHDEPAAASSEDGRTDAAKPADTAVANPDDRMADLNRRVEELNARFHGWTYVLPVWKYSAMDKTINDLLQPVETGKPLKGANPAAKPEVKAARPRPVNAQ